MIRVAIPDQPIRQRPLPDGEAAKAIAAIALVAKEIEDSLAFGFLDQPRARASVDYSETLHVILNTPGAGTLYDYVATEWRWGLLWEAEDWYEVGWHPCCGYLKLQDRWQSRLWRALNPGKGLALARSSSCRNHAR